MKVLLCLMGTITACNAGLLNGLLGGSGGGSGSQFHVEVQPQHLHHLEEVQHVQHEHVAHAPQQQVKIVKIQNSGGGYGGGHGGGYDSGYGGGHDEDYSGGHSYSIGHSHGYSGVSYSQPQRIKVINEEAPVSHSIDSGYAIQKYSSGHGHSHGDDHHDHSHAPHHSYYQSSVQAILPHILKIVLGDSGGYQQGSAYSGQLIHAYGTSGRAFVSNGGNDFLRSGHVVEKGHIEVVNVDQQSGGGGLFSGLFGGNNGGGGGRGSFGGTW